MCVVCICGVLYGFINLSGYKDFFFLRLFEREHEPAWGAAEAEGEAGSPLSRELHGAPFQALGILT